MTSGKLSELRKGKLRESPAISSSLASDQVWLLQGGEWEAYRHKELHQGGRREKKETRRTKLKRKERELDEKETRRKGR